MLVPSRRSRLLLLLLLLFLAALSARNVRCESVEVWAYGSGLEARWNRTGDWAGVNNFTVTINSTEGSCTEDTTCSDDPCWFTSEKCRSLKACSHNEMTVSGGSTTSGPISFQAAPEPVTDLDVQMVEGVLHIKWTNPSIESSWCYDDTAVQVKDEHHTISSSYHFITEESVTVSLLCEFDDGSVEVWTRGGDGYSHQRDLEYKYNGPVPATGRSCQAVGCYGIVLMWDYHPVCPNVTHFCVWDGHEGELCTEDTATTSLQLTGLKEDMGYLLSISAHGTDGLIWRSSSRVCRTHGTAVRNLAAVSTSPSSINATWDPPLCLSFDGLVYEVSINTSDCSSNPQDNTTNTGYMWTDLEDFEKYYVCVAAEGKEMDKKILYTLPQRPAWLRLGMARDDSVLVEWEDMIYHGFKGQYEVTSGNKTYYTGRPWFTIKGYNSTDALGLVCVAVFMERSDWGNVTSPTRCSDDPGQKPIGKPNVLLITLLCVGIPMTITVLGGVALALRKRQKETEELPSTFRRDRPDRDAACSKQLPNERITKQ